MNITFGSCWWSGSFTAGGGAGAQGCLVVFNSGSYVNGGNANDGEVMAYDPLTNKWFYEAVGKTPFAGANGGSPFHQVAEDSAAKNCLGYGGGHADRTPPLGLKA